MYTVFGDSNTATSAIGSTSTNTRSAQQPPPMWPAFSRPTTRADPLVAAASACSADSPHSVRSSSSTARRSCRLNGVPESVPAAMRTPARCAMRTPSRWRSATARVLSITTGSRTFACSSKEWIAANVGMIATSRSLRRRMVRSSRRVACSTESMPASAATRMPPEPWACVVIRSPALWASATAAAVSSGVNCDTCRRRAFAQHPSGREDLDDPSARADLLADRFPHLIGSIGNASDLGPVTAGGRHAPASGDDPRSFDHAALDRAAELDDHRSIRAKVAYGRHAGVQRGACVLERLDHRQAVGLSHLGREVRLAIERQVRVTVDEAGDREAARGLSDLAAVFRQRLSLTRPRDLAAIDDDRRVLDDVFAVKKPVELEHRSHRPQERPQMPDTLRQRLRARDLVLPDYAGGGLINVAATMLDILGARNESDPLPLRDLSVALREGVRQVLVVLADGLGLGQLRALCASGDVPFLASLLDRAGRNDGAQLIEARTIFPSTTAAAITTLNTARTPQEHGNIAYFVWLEEFAAVTQMLRWGPGVTRRGSFFDNQTIDPRDYVKVPSVPRP